MFIGRIVSISKKIATETFHYNNCDFPQKLQIKFNLSQTPHNYLHKGLTTYYKRLIKGVGFEVRKNSSKKKAKKCTLLLLLPPPSSSSSPLLLHSCWMAATVETIVLVINANVRKSKKHGVKLTEAAIAMALAHPFLDTTVHTMGSYCCYC